VDKQQIPPLPFGSFHSLRVRSGRRMMSIDLWISVRFG
jgi:hypothetical protein